MPRGPRKAKKLTGKGPYKANPLFPSKPRSYRVGGDIQHKRNLSRFVKWPRYVRLQRQRKILYSRLKVPPAINQFKRGLSRDQLAELQSLMENYKPLTRKEKRQKREEAAKAANEGTTASVDKVISTQFGLNHVVSLIEK